MPNAKTKVKTRAARPTLSVLKESLKRHTFPVRSDEARAAAGQGALLPEAQRCRQAYERARRLAPTLGLDAPRREAKSA